MTEITNVGYIKQSCRNGFCKPSFLVFHKKNLKTYEVQILVSLDFLEYLKYLDFRLTVTTQKLLLFNLISCVYSYAIVYAWQ